MVSKRKGDAWEGVTMEEVPGSKMRKVTCKFCEKVFSTASVGRVREHLLSQGSGISGCTPKEPMKEMHAAFVLKLKTAEDKESEKAKTKQLNMVPFLARATTAVDAHEAIRDFFYEEAIGFNKANGRAFLTMVSVLCGLSARDGYTPPTPDELGGVMLDNAIKEMDSLMTRGLRQEAKFGLTVLCDGWTDCNNQAILNGLICSSRRSYYISNRATGSESKTMAYVAGYVKEIISTLPADLRSCVVHVCLDGACAAALPLIEAAVPKILGSLCLLHTQDLLLEDFGDWCKPSTKTEFAFFNVVVQEGSGLVRFIKARQKLVSLLKNRSELRLLLPADTRFGSYFLVLARLVKLKAPLRALFASEEFTTWKTEVKTAAGRKTASDWQVLVLADQFWEKTQLVTKIGGIVFQSLKKADSDDASESSASLEHTKTTFRNLKEAIKALPRSSYLTPARQKTLCARVESRWQYHRRPVHEAAHALSPQFRDESRNDDDARSGLMAILGRMYDTDTALEALAQYEDWSVYAFESLELRAIQKAWAGQKWWSMFGARWPLLKKVAVNLLGQTSAAGAAERGWSVYGDVHTRKRNRLAATKAGELTRITYNKRNTAVTLMVAGYWEASEIILGDDAIENTDADA